VNWPRLTPSAHPEGSVVFGVSRPDTVVGVTRIAVLMSHHYGAQPLAVHVAGGHKPTWEGAVDLEGERLFEIARAEAETLGYPLRSYSEFAVDVVAGIRQAADALQPHVVVLGQSIAHRATGFARIADAVTAGRTWPLILTKLGVSEPFRSVLVPLTIPSELARLQPVLSVLGEIATEQTRLLFLVHAATLAADVERQREELTLVADSMSLAGQILYRTVVDMSPVEAILEARTENDVVVMNTAGDRTSPSVFSRSLAEEVAQSTNLPILLVRGDLRPQRELRNLDDDEK